MRGLLRIFLLTAAATAVDGPNLGHAQEKATASAAKPIVPLSVQIVIARYQGDKKIASLPYTLAVNSGDGEFARLRMGAEVPVQTFSGPPEIDGKPTPFTGPVQYRKVGTNIDCMATVLGDGRFRLQISIEESSIVMDGQSAPDVLKLQKAPVFRSFQLNNTAILRDGQSVQFTAATDRITGEVVRVDVTLTVVK